MAGEFVLRNRVFPIRFWRIVPGTRGDANATVECQWAGTTPPAGMFGLVTLRLVNQSGKGFFNVPAIVGERGELIRGTL